MSSRLFLAAALVGVLLSVSPAEEAPVPRPLGQKEGQKAEGKAADKAADAKAEPTAAAALDRKILDEVKARSELMTNLRYLSDVIGPRLTGSKSLELANNWAAERMKAYGLENVRLEPWEIPVGWQRGTATVTLVEPNPGRSLLVAARGWTPGTQGKVTGDVVYLEARTKADLAKYKGKLKNALVMRTPPSNVAPVSDLAYGPGGGGPKKDFPKKDAAKDDAPKKDEPKAEAKKDEPKKADVKKDEPKKDAPPAKKDEPKAENPAGPAGRAGFAEMQALRREMDEFLKAEGVAAVITDSAKPHGLLVTTGGWREGDRATAQDPLPSL